MESYIIDSFVMGYHDYKDIWSPIMNEELKTRIEPDNPVDKYAVAVIDENNEIVGHLMKGLNGKFAKTIFFFLRSNLANTCKVIITGSPVNLGRKKGMQVPCKLELDGKIQYVEILKIHLTL